MNTTSGPKLLTTDDLSTTFAEALREAANTGNLGADQEATVKRLLHSYERARAEGQTANAAALAAAKAEGLA